MRRIFVAILAMLAAVLSACGSGGVIEGRKYYSSDERKGVMTGPYDKFAMRVQAAMQSGELGETVSYVLPEQGYFPWMCATGGERAPQGYAGQVQVCTADGRYTLSGVTLGSPQFAEGKVFAIRADDIDASKDKDGVVAGRYKDGSGKLVSINSFGTRAEIESDDARLTQVFKSRIFK